MEESFRRVSEEKRRIILWEQSRKRRRRSGGWGGWGQLRRWAAPCWRSVPVSGFFFAWRLHLVFRTSVCLLWFLQGSPGLKTKVWVVGKSPEGLLRLEPTQDSPPSVRSCVGSGLCYWDWLPQTPPRPPRPTSPAPPADSCRNICLCARNEVGQPVQADPWRWRGPFVPGRLVHARRVTRRAQILVLQPIITYALTQKTQNFSFPRSSHEWTLLKNPVSSCSRGKMRFQRLSFKRLDTPQTCHDLLLIYVFLKWK